MRNLASAYPIVNLLAVPGGDPTVSEIPRLLEARLTTRCPVRVTRQGQAGFDLELALDTDLEAESYSMQDRPGGGVRIAGGDARGLLYGVGKFLRTSRYGEHGFTPGAWRGVSAPEKPVRGIYFATHFHNFYHEAPAEEIARYVEDLALWGLNTLSVWYDMHHFNGFDDPAAVAFRERLDVILGAARRIGMDVSFTTIANEGYGDSPAALRADIGGMRGAKVPTEICTSKPEGQQYVLDNFERLFGWAARHAPRYLWIWPYDSGGCGCVDCQPWGNNGFLKAAEPLAELARRKLPGVKIVLSTWYMDQNEWPEVARYIREKPDVADALMIEHMNEVPMAQAFRESAALGLPVLGFPEISMYETFPWGGFGATPLTAHVRRQWDTVKAHCAGGFPYSEGIYDDLTKVVYAQFYWNDRPREETIREYIAYEFSPDVVEEVAAAIKTLERNHRFRWWPGKLEGVKLILDWFPSSGATPQADPGAEEAYATFRRVDAKLSPAARRSWRWRQLYLRALLDAELKANGGSPNEACNAAFAELIELYHAQNADPVVRPPLPKP